MSYGNGYAVYGRDPVFADVDDMLARIDAAEQRAEAVDGYIADAVDHLLASADDRDVLYVLATEAGNIRRRVELGSIYNVATGECEADSHDEWNRVLFLCADEHLPMLRQQWRAWCAREVAQVTEVVKVAERMADDADELAAEDAALLRAGL